jgi:predicted aldo/keto reductase-like oxidoreductase
MRFPRDKAEVERIILTAVEGGINFFDTAYIYPGSEVALGEVLTKHSLREKVYISTKLPITRCRSIDDVERFFQEQLRRLQTDYIDYYFMHNISYYEQWEKLQSIGIEDWIAEKKASGQIGQIGFSYHGTHDDFIQVIDSYSWEFCLIQHNYYDPNYQAGAAGLSAAAEKGMTIMIMEPLLGGQLATGLPDAAVKVFADQDSSMSPADWALWWLWNQPEVSVVLSGMNSAAIVEKNLSAAERFRTLTDDELATYPQVVDIIREKFKINCTSCNYCLPCPKGINIPACLSAYNTSYAKGLVAGMTLYLTTTGVLSEKPKSPYLCNACGRCEKACPQHLPVIASLKKVGRRFEPAPVRWTLSLVRKIMSR